VVAAVQAIRHLKPRACPRKSFRQRIHVGCFAPDDFILVGEEMLLVAARRRMSRGRY
jgi:sarcosine oxidase gamma subunit